MPSAIVILGLACYLGLTEMPALLIAVPPNIRPNSQHTTDACELVFISVLLGCETGLEDQAEVPRHRILRPSLRLWWYGTLP